MPGRETALIQASANGHLTVVQLLVTHGADVNLRVWADAGPGQIGGEWRTALVAARRGGHDPVAAYLLSQGARE